MQYLTILLQEPTSITNTTVAELVITLPRDLEWVMYTWLIVDPCMDDP